MREKDCIHELLIVNLGYNWDSTCSLDLSRLAYNIANCTLGRMHINDACTEEQPRDEVTAEPGTGPASISGPPDGQYHAH